MPPVPDINLGFTLPAAPLDHSPIIQAQNGLADLKSKINSKLTNGLQGSANDLLAKQNFISGMIGNGLMENQQKLLKMKEKIDSQLGLHGTEMLVTNIVAGGDPPPIKAPKPPPMPAPIIPKTPLPKTPLPKT